MHFYIMTISSLREAAVQMQLLPLVHVYLLISDKEKKMFGKKADLASTIFEKRFNSFLYFVCMPSLVLMNL